MNKVLLIKMLKLRKKRFEKELADKEELFNGLYGDEELDMLLDMLSDVETLSGRLEELQDIISLLKEED